MYQRVCVWNRGKATLCFTTIDIMKEVITEAKLFAIVTIATVTTLSLQLGILQKLVTSTHTH